MQCNLGLVPTKRGLDVAHLPGHAFDELGADLTADVETDVVTSPVADILLGDRARVALGVDDPPQLIIEGWP